MSRQRKLARGVLGIALLGSSLGFVSMARSVAQGTPTVYSFDSCDEGWVAADDHPVIQESWVRKEPGHESDMGFHVGPPYPVGAGNPGDVITGTLTSAAHTAPGGDLPVSYFVRHKLETDFDYLFFEWSSDGEEWTTLDTLNGDSAGFPAFTPKQTVVPAPAGNLFLRFRFTSDQSLSGNDMFGIEGEMGIDTVTVPLARPAEAACEGGQPSPGGSASPTPEPSPTDPGSSGGNHRRKVTIGLKHASKLVVSGAVTVPDGFNKCRSRVPVQIQRLKSGRYQSVGKGRTNAKGRYSVKVSDSPGRYRTRATTVKKGTETCNKAVAVKQHRH